MRISSSRNFISILIIVKRKKRERKRNETSYTRLSYVHAFVELDEIIF
jgi:hypothetical protein